MKRGLPSFLISILCLLLIFNTIPNIYSSWNIAYEKTAEITTEEPICFFTTSSDNATHYYYSIEAAIIDANAIVNDSSKSQSEVEVIVLPATETNSCKYISVEHSITIDSGVTLTLPYKVNDDTYTFYNEDEHGTDLFADGSEDLVKKNRKIQLSMASNVTLTVKGTLNIGGVLCRPDIGVSGQTTGYYCEITMEDKSNIDCNGGTINCYGYIKRKSSDTTATLKVRNDGTLLTPFVIYDFKGGSITLGIYNLDDSNKYSPFQIFDFCNIQVEATIYSGSSWNANVSIYIASSDDKKYFGSVVSFISPNAENTALILSSGSISLNYVPFTQGITTSAVDNTKTTVKINGVVDIGYISISIEYKGAVLNFNTSDFFFPICYRYSFIAESGTLNLTKRVKLMNGSSFEICSGATLNVTSSFAIYKDDLNEDNKDYSYYCYPNGLDAAKFVNNGIVNVSSSGSIGGDIGVNEEGATLNYISTNYSVASPEYSSKTSTTIVGITFTTITARNINFSAKGNIIVDDVLFESNNITQNDYLSLTLNNSVAWESSNKIYSLSFYEESFSQDETCGSVTLKAVINDTSEFSSILKCEWSTDTDNSNITLEPSNNIMTIKNISDADITLNITLKVTNSKTSQSMDYTSEITVYGKQAGAEKEDIKSAGISCELIYGTTNFVYDKSKENTTVFKITATVDPTLNGSSNVKYIWGLSKGSTANNVDKYAKFKKSGERDITTNVINLTTAATNTDFNNLLQKISYKWCCTSPDTYNNNELYLAINGAVTGTFYVALKITFTNMSGEEDSVIASNYFTFTRAS